MSDARSTYRYAALLLGGSVLVVGALIASGIHGTSAAVSAEETGAPVAARANSPEFEKWAADSDEVDGKGRLIGEIERNGKMVELRQLPDGTGPEQPDHDLAPDEAVADQNEPAR